MPIKRRSTSITSGMAAGQLSEASQDNISLDVREQGLALARNVRLLRDGGVRTRNRLEASGASAIDPRAWNAVMGWRHDATKSRFTPLAVTEAPAIPVVTAAAPDVDGIVGLERAGDAPIAGASFDLAGVTTLPTDASALSGLEAFFRVDLDGGAVRAVTLHGCRLTAGSWQTDERLTFRAWVFGTSPGAAAGSAKSWQEVLPTSGTSSQDPFDFRAFSPGLTSRDVSVQLDKDGVRREVDAFAITVISQAAGDALTLQVEGISALREVEAGDTDTARIITPARFVRLIPWSVKGSENVLVLTPFHLRLVGIVRSGERAGRLASEWEVESPPPRDDEGNLLNDGAARNFTLRQIREMTWTRLGTAILLLHQDFPYPLQLGVVPGQTLTNISLTPYSLQNVPDLPEGQRADASAELIAGGSLAIQQVGVFVAPSGLRVERVGETSLRASWRRVGGAVSYDVAWTTRAAYDADPAAFLAARPATRDGRSLPGDKAADVIELNSLITGLTADTEYVVLVRSEYEASQRSGWSDAVVVTPFATPGVPTGLSVSYIAPAGYRQLSWTAVANATSYEVESRVGVGAWTSVGSSVSTTATFVGSAGTAYEFRVRAVRTVRGVTAASGWTAPVASAALSPVRTVQKPAGASRSGGTYRVSWTKVVGAVSYSVVTRDGAGRQVDTRVVGDVAFVDIRLTVGQSYSSRVQGLGQYFQFGDFSPWSDLVELRTDAPVLTLIESRQGTQLRRLLSWPAPTGATQYQVERREGSGAWGNVADQTALTFQQDLDPYKSYSYRVRARASATASWSDWSNVVTSGARQLTPTPTGLTFTRQSGSVIRAAWTPTAGAVRYDVEFFFATPGRPTFIRRVSTQSTTADLTDAVAGNIYSVAVRAFDEFGLGSSYSRMVSRLAGPPAAPSAIRLRLVTSTGFPPLAAYRLDSRPVAGRDLVYQGWGADRSEAEWRDFPDPALVDGWIVNSLAYRGSAGTYRVRVCARGNGETLYSPETSIQLGQ